MSNRRITSLLRLRHARVTLRNAAGSRLTEAESVLNRAIAWQESSRTAAETHRAEGATRFHAARNVSEFLEYDDERKSRLREIVEADAAHEEAEKHANEARKALALCEQELRRVEKVLEKLRRARRTREHKVEQAAHDDLTNAKFHMDAVIEEER